MNCHHCGSRKTEIVEGWDHLRDEIITFEKCCKCKKPLAIIEISKVRKDEEDIS